MTTRTFKALSVALLALGATASLAVPAAQAAPEFTAGSYPATIDGEQTENHVFTLGGRKVICEKTIFQGTLAGASTQLTLTPTYSQCHSMILGISFPVTVTENSCDVRATATKEGSEYKAHMDIVCPGANEIEIHFYENATAHSKHISICTDRMGTQNGITSWSLPSFHDLVDFLKAIVSLGGLFYKVEGSSLICGSGGSEGTYTGSANLKATNGGGTLVNFSVSG